MMVTPAYQSTDQLIQTDLAGVDVSVADWLPPAMRQALPLDTNKAGYIPQEAAPGCLLVHNTKRARE